MKICIAGKSQIAVHVLLALSTRFTVVCLPNPDDHGIDGWQPSFRRVAEGLGHEIASLESLYGLDDLLFLSLEYSQLIDPARFRSTRLFNIHFSLLPKFRGCNSAIWPILNGETEHGVTLHQIDKGMDTGPIIDRRAFKLEGMTAFDAYLTCQRVGIDLALDWIDRLVAGDFTATPQEGEGSTYRRRDLDYGLKNIDLSESTETVLRRVHAFTFPVYQRPLLEGREVHGGSASAVEGWTERPTGTGKVWLDLRTAE